MTNRFGRRPSRPYAVAARLTASAIAFRKMGATYAEIMRALGVSKYFVQKVMPDDLRFVNRKNRGQR